MSPELVLVDADLAAVLRRTPRPHVEPFARAETPSYDAIPYASSGVADDLIIEPTEHLGPATLGCATRTAAVDLEPITADEYIVLPDDEREAVAPSVRKTDLDVLDLPNPLAPSVQVPGAGSEAQDTSSHYPRLPALDPRSSDQTDAALRHIREHLAGAVDPPTSRRLVRRRFVVAAGASAVYALMFLTLGIHLGFVNVSALPLR